MVVLCCPCHRWPHGLVTGPQSTLLFLAVVLFLVHFLHLHAPVLKPDFDLSLGQIQDPGDLEPAVSGQVHIKQKLLF